MSDNSEFLQEFIAEATEHLDSAEACLLELGKDPGKPAGLDACFRDLHSIKGGAGFLDLARIQALAHAAEHLLSQMREGHCICTSDIVDALLHSVSRLRELVAAVGGGEEPSPSEGNDGPDGKWLQRLKVCAQTDRHRVQDYAPIHQSPDAAQEATSRRIKRTDAQRAVRRSVVSPDALLARILALETDDLPGLVDVVTALESAAAHQSWPDAARAVLVRIKGLADGLVDGRPVPGGFSSIYSLAGELQGAFQAAAPAAANSAAVESPTSKTEPVPVSGGNPVTAFTVLVPPTPVPVDQAQIEEFVAEAAELLTAAEEAVVKSGGSSSTDIAAVFRTFHTFKSMAAYLGLTRIEALAHRLETELLPVRDGTVPFSPGLRALALAGIDALRGLAAHVRAQGNDGGAWPAAALNLATRFGLTGDGAQVEEPSIEGAPPIADILAEVGVPREVISAEAQTLKPGEDLTARLVKTGKITQAQADQANARQQELAGKQDSFARVSTARLEELMNLVGELLIAQAMVAQDEALPTIPRLMQSVTRQGRIVRDLQALSLGLRMVPLKATFQKMARAVHDAARKLNKQVDLKLTGEDTEIDRTLGEILADPLLHMIRNAVDHGIEMPAARAKNGKPERGTVHLSASQTSDQVVIELTDDGKGMDPVKLRAKAIEKGLIPADRVLSDKECYDLIFLAGFSTAEQVTGISGRGVGMDVVRRNVERMKGRVEITSQVGKGSVFTIRLPLTTAILDAMSLRVGIERFLVPITAVVEANRPHAGEVSEVLGQGRVMQARGQLLPVVALGDIFSLSGFQPDPTQAVVLVLEHIGGRLALQVDEILGLQQVVIKPLDQDTPHHPGLAGTAILGDGRVGLILDPDKLLAVQTST